MLDLPLPMLSRVLGPSPKTKQDRMWEKDKETHKHQVRTYRLIPLEPGIEHETSWPVGNGVITDPSGCTMIESKLCDLSVMCRLCLSFSKSGFVSLFDLFCRLHFLRSISSTDSAPWSRGCPILWTLTTGCVAGSIPQGGFFAHYMGIGANLGSYWFAALIPI